MRKQKLPKSIFGATALYTWGDMAGRPPTKDAPLFGQRLSSLRKARGLSQEELASRLGTTRANLAYYERKAGNPTLDFILRCSEILEIPPEELIGEGQAARRKPGPKSKLEKQFEAIAKLPKGEQKFFSQMIERFLREHSAEAS